MIPVIPVKQETPHHDGEGPKVDYAAVVQRYKDKITNRASAIRAKCVECSCGVLSEVRNCTVKQCALWPFRNGEDPYRKKRTDGFVGGKKDEGDDE